MIWKASLLLNLALCVLSDERPAVSEQKLERFYSGHHGELSHIGHHEPEHHEVYAWAYPSYEFSYYVDDPHTHDQKGQHEIRDGDKVSGNYWLIQPDGRKRTVKYHSDHKSGFHAEVNYLPYDGHHPDAKEHHEKHRYIEEYKEVRREADENRRYENDGYERRYGWDHGYKDNDRWEYDYKRNEGRHERRDGIWDVKRGGGHKNGHDENHSHEGRLWGIPGWGRGRNDYRDDRREGHEIGGWRKNNDHEEHWKHGVLVGWKNGKGTHDRHGDDDRQGYDNDREHRRNYVPIMNFKPLIPYGHRLQ